MGSRRRAGPGTGWFAAVTAAAMAFGLFGCSSSAPEDGRPNPGAERPERVVERSPFTGLRAGIKPVLAVKIDNVRAARPHTGLGAADLVYVERVEGGQSRLLAVFSSHLPPALGPVRSARESDIELLRQFGRPALAYSGAQSALLPQLKAAPVHHVSPEQAPGAYFRDHGRQSPHNLFVRPQRALTYARGTDTAHDIGFRFGAAPEHGRTARVRTVRFPFATYQFTWSAQRHRWLVSMDGKPAATTDGGRLGAATVVVQHVTIRQSRFHDRLGAVTPYTETVGAGTATVLRDGKEYQARWKRGAASDGTTFTTPSGDRLNFARGPVWVLLVEH